jgi:RNA ligase (TIGR02306 family)
VETKSTHKVEVIRIDHVEPHPNAERLEVVHIWGYTACVAKGQFKPGDLAAYIPPDSIVPETPDFAFLGDHRRIKVKRLRGIYSQGLLMPAPPGAQVGDDVACLLGVTHYEPPLPMVTGGESETAPAGFRPHYDVDSWYRFGSLFHPGEPVAVTEKVHGASARYCWQEGRLRCGSRGEWKKEDPRSIWWLAVGASPWLVPFLQEHPDITVYGEVYGVQKLKYGVPKGEARLAVFDLFRGNAWVPHVEARQLGAGLAWVPSLYVGPYDETAIRPMADGPSLIPGADHIREGIVVKPLEERTDPQIGRVQLKIVSNQYLEGD